MPVFRYISTSCLSCLAGGLAAVAVTSASASSPQSGSRHTDGAAIFALSELQPYDPATDGVGDPPEPPLVPDVEEGPVEPGATGEGPGEETAPPAEDAIAILYDPGLLPEPAARMRELIREAAMTGDVEALRPLIGIGPAQTRIAPSPIDEDPVEYLRESSGDGGGQEILAILLDILDAGFVMVERPEEEGGKLYMWPYFYALPLDDLSAPQKVELFRIVTAGDYEEMKAYGGYNFYRLGITAEGEWEYFFAGH